MANKTITQLDTAQSLNDNMVIAVQDTNTTYKTTLADVKAYCGSSSGDKYKVGDRVTDDSDNPVGTVSSIKTDADSNRYAVVCLDGSYRGNSLQYLSSDEIITDLPQYSNQLVWENKETATFNTQKILDYASSHSLSSGACNLCRAASFIINGVTYYGQLPTIDELIDIFKNRTIINTQDTSGNNPLPYKQDTHSSTQYNNYYNWYINSLGTAGHDDKHYFYFVIPVLEIPLED